MKSYITEFAHFSIHESVSAEDHLRNKVRLNQLGISNIGITYASVEIDWSLIDNYDVYRRDFITMRIFTDWLGEGGEIKQWSGDIADIEEFNTEIYTEEHYGFMPVKQILGVHQQNLMEVQVRCQWIAGKLGADILRIHKNTGYRIESENGGAPVKFNFPGEERWFLKQGPDQWVPVPAISKEVLQNK